MHVSNKYLPITTKVVRHYFKCAWDVSANSREEKTFPFGAFVYYGEKGD